MADLWRRAFSGLTPRVLAIVAALLLLRAVDTAIEAKVLYPDTWGSDGWLAKVFANFKTMLLQAVPMIVIVIATGNLGPQRGPKRIVALAAAVVVSAGIGAMLRGPSIRAPSELLSMLSVVWPRYALLGGLLTIVAELYRSEMASEKAARQAEIDRAAFETELSEARLQMLQAQIEPHFLFNTLANARRLYAEDHAAGRTMLESLMRYLEVALPQMRQGETTLASDVALIEAYLTIQRIRMGSRLAFTIDIAPELRGNRVPSMMLLTLVENAIKHGLAPSPEGGLIRIGARANGNSLELTVADTGVGFGSALGSGVGLANISARLAAQFGAAATLVLQNNEFGGATVTIALPLIDREAGGRVSAHAGRPAANATIPQSSQP